MHLALFYWKYPRRVDSKIHGNILQSFNVWLTYNNDCAYSICSFNIEWSTWKNNVHQLLSIKWYLTTAQFCYFLLFYTGSKSQIVSLNILLYIYVYTEKWVQLWKWTLVLYDIMWVLILVGWSELLEIVLFKECFNYID